MKHTDSYYTRRYNELKDYLVYLNGLGELNREGRMLVEKTTRKMDDIKHEALVNNHIELN